MYEEVVMKTPVDTGRARGNWHITMDVQSGTVLERKTQGPLQGETQKLRVIKGDSKIYIQNNLPYILALEYGHSKQAPKGMLRKTVLQMKKFIKQAVEES